MSCKEGKGGLKDIHCSAQKPHFLFIYYKKSVIPPHMVIALLTIATAIISLIFAPRGDSEKKLKTLPYYIDFVLTVTATAILKE